jgi:tyrosine-protein phosphatase
MSPGFSPLNTNTLSKPPPSPGFGAHRFGASGGFGFSSLNLGAPPKPMEKKEAAPERHVTIMRAFPDDAALLSPRAETMTNNPIHQAISGVPGMQFVEVPPTPTDGMFSPRETIFPRDPFFPFGRPIQVADPRSPPTKGESPIVRSIDDML